MADGAFRFHQPGAGQYYPNPAHRNNRPSSPSSGRRPFNNDTPSPSRSPVGHSLGHNFNMYSQNGYQGQHGLMNGQNHQRYGNMHMQQKYQQTHHGGHHNQHHGHHHAGQIGGHQHNISGGFQSGTPHLPAYGHDHMSNGNGNGVLHDEADDIDNEYWRNQQEFYETSKELSGPNQRARTVAHHSKGVNYVPLGAAADDMQTDNLRATPGTISSGKSTSGQTWDELDLGGQGLCALSPVLFKSSYIFLKRLDLVYNQLTSLPPDIGCLKNLEHLDVSFNQLTELPEEIGMLTNLKHLLLFNNHIQTLCYELGFLFKLEMLGIYGNPLEQGQREKITEGGTRKLIEYLRESMPGM
jgi:CCR4-NOT transcription complex subunit 6